MAKTRKVKHSRPVWRGDGTNKKGRSERKGKKKKKETQGGSKDEKNQSPKKTESNPHKTRNSSKSSPLNSRLDESGKPAIKKPKL